MKLLLILFLSLLLTIKNSGGSFDIGVFIIYLQESGYWNILLYIKKSFNEQVAIDICTLLTGSPNDCEQVVRLYMLIPISSKECPLNPLEALKQILFNSDEPITDKKLSDLELTKILSKYCPS